MSFSSPVRRGLGSSSFAGEETEAQERSPQSAWRSLNPELVLPRCRLPLAPQLQPAPQPWAAQEPHSCVIVPLSPQDTGCWGSGQRQNFVESGGNCPASPSAVTLLLCTALHTHIPATCPSVCLVHALLATWKHLPRGVTSAHTAYIQCKEI